MSHGLSLLSSPVFTSHLLTAWPICFLRPDPRNFGALRQALLFPLLALLLPHRLCPFPLLEERMPRMLDLIVFFSFVLQSSTAFYKFLFLIRFCPHEIGPWA